MMAKMVKRSPSSINFDRVIQTFADDADFQKQLMQANVVILPRMGVLHYTGPVFEADTRELYRYLRDHSSDKLRIEIAIRDEDYAEYVAHADILELGKFLVCTLVAPFFVNVLSNYVSDKLKYRSTKENPKTTVRAELILTNKDGSSVSFKFDGPATVFEKALGGEIREFIRGVKG
ncbi:hypothetical protein [Neomoorella thermoacetica]|uniref:hypothetical protein n=1 Tax=Neomoorella thermoacetica TaxID=1525 RepID=UPI0030D4AAB6